MAGLLEITLDISKLPKEKFFKGKKGVYYTFTAAVNDDTSKIGKNVSVWDEQTEDQRANKEPKNYIGSGRVFWTDGTMTRVEKVAKAKEEAPAEVTYDEEDDGLPF
jgi:hypothetical protein